MIGVYWPQDYFIRIDHVEDQLLIDFIVYICSSIGIWFGLSFCSLLTPAQKFSERKKIQKKIEDKEQNGRMEAMFLYFQSVTREMKRKIYYQNREIISLKLHQIQSRN